MQSDLEYKLQNILLEKNDSNGPLISWKISTDILKFTHSDKKGRNPTLVWNIIVYMFDEQIEDLYAAAGSHSNEFQNILDDTWVVSEKTDINMFSKNLYEPHLSWYSLKDICSLLEVKGSTSVVASHSATKNKKCSHSLQNSAMSLI